MSHFRKTISYESIHSTHCYSPVVDNVQHNVMDYENCLGLFFTEYIPMCLVCMFHAYKNYSHPNLDLTTCHTSISYHCELCFKLYIPTLRSHLSVSLYIRERCNAACALHHLASFECVSCHLNCRVQSELAFVFDR